MFKVGDRVKLRKSSYFYGNPNDEFDDFNPRDTLGVVISIEGNLSGSLYIDVCWLPDSESPAHNCYSDVDLDLVGLVQHRPPIKVWG